MMNIIKHLSPDPPGGTGSDDTPHYKPGIPQKDIDFGDVAKKVAESWTAHPEITLVYSNAATLTALATQYRGTLMVRISTGGQRPSQTQTLATLRTSSKAAAVEVKVYIEKKFKKAGAEAQFPRYGLVKENETWQLPRDSNKRLAALQLMRDAITADGFDTEEYGKAFWLKMQTDYTAALSTANTTDGSISLGVSGKNNLKKEIKKIMKSLRRMLEGNYPDSYQAMYRSWGWQKEDY